MNKTAPEYGFLKNQTYLGHKNGQRLWTNHDRNRYFTWDRLHGEIEVYNKRGRHLGALDSISGVFIKNAVKGRKIDV